MDKKKLEEIIEDATADCHDLEEQFSGFYATLESELAFPFEAEILGKKVMVKNVTEKEERIIAELVILEEEKSSVHEVDILDLKNIQGEKNVELVEAYRLWKSRCF